jgi:CheY-like chemotaxis protein
MPDEKKILIVDDEQDITDIIETVLSQLDGISTTSEHDGASGLEKAKELLPDLIILDVMMPEKNGFEVFGELKKSDTAKNIPVIMLTSVAEKTNINFSADDMEGYLGTPPEAYIEKPVEPAVLQKTVSNILGL